MTKQELYALIDEKVYQNNNREITGAGLNEVLKAIADNAGGIRYIISSADWASINYGGDTYATLAELSEDIGISEENIEALWNGEVAVVEFNAAILDAVFTFSAMPYMYPSSEVGEDYKEVRFSLPGAMINELNASFVMFGYDPSNTEEPYFATGFLITG